MQDYKEYQTELFNEFSKRHSKKRKIFKSAPKIKNINIILSQEKLIFLVIVIILLYIIIFSLGVERGKKLKNQLSLVADKGVNQTQQVEVKSAKEGELQIPEQLQVLVYNKIYTIQTAAYVKLSQAEKELKKLKEEGYDVFIVSTGKYYIIFVGRFKDKQKAASIQKKLRAKYKDCFIKDILMEE